MIQVSAANATYYEHDAAGRTDSVYNPAIGVACAAACDRRASAGRKTASARAECDRRAIKVAVPVMPVMPPLCLTGASSVLPNGLRISSRAKPGSS